MDAAFRTHIEFASSNGGQAIPKPIPITRAMIGWFILALLIPSGAHAVPWAKRTIGSLQSTNELILPVPPPPDRARSALDALRGDRVLADPLWGMSTNRTITGIAGEGEIDEETLDARMEMTRIRQFIERIDVLLRNRDHQTAIQQVQHELEFATNDDIRFILHHRLGTIYFRTQEYAQAAVHMAKALEIQPNNAAIASNLAAAQMTMGDLDSALNTLSSIQLGLIDNRSLLFSIHFNLACLYSMKGREEEALEHLFKAAESDPPSAFASLGDPQLDPIRSDFRFRDLQRVLENRLTPQPAPSE